MKLCLKKKEKEFFNIRFSVLENPKVKKIESRKLHCRRKNLTW